MCLKIIYGSLSLNREPKMNDWNLVHIFASSIILQYLGYPYHLRFVSKSSWRLRYRVVGHMRCFRNIYGASSP